TCQTAAVAGLRLNARSSGTAFIVPHTFSWISCSLPEAQNCNGHAPVFLSPQIQDARVLASSTLVGCGVVLRICAWPVLSCSSLGACGRFSLRNARCECRAALWPGAAG